MISSCCFGFLGQSPLCCLLCIISSFIEEKRFYVPFPPTKKFNLIFLLDSTPVFLNTGHMYVHSLSVSLFLHTSIKMLNIVKHILTLQVVLIYDTLPNEILCFIIFLLENSVLFPPFSTPRYIQSIS